MHHVLISLAANVNPKKNLCNARKALAQVLSQTVYTEELWTEPCSPIPSLPSNDAKQQDASRKEGRQRLYLNQLVSAETTLSTEQLNQRLKEIEVQMGRTPEHRRQRLVPLDLDLMEYDGERHHLPDWQRPYMQLLLKLI